jgi:nicotinate-nucleotide adenylyltransferase
VNIALFGGTFDPIHTGHLQVAEAAAARFQLDQILFIPTGNPPHKRPSELTPFPHRFAMVALACVGDHRFLPAVLEAPTADGRPHYSIATVRKAKKLVRSNTNLSFLLGADAFLDLPHWKEYRRLLDLVDFIVVSRPGFEQAAISKIVPGGLLRARQVDSRSDVVRLRHSTLSILRGVEVPVASREIREAIRAGRRVAGLVPALVEQYIVKAGLYQSPEAR